MFASLWPEAADRRYRSRIGQVVQKTSGVPMARRLKVDDDELTRFMRLLDRSNESLQGLRKALCDATTTGLGTDDLDRACEEFQDDWKFGAEQLGKQTEDLAKIVAKSKESYREVDDALEAAMNKAKAKATKSAGGGGAK
ncbi:hypothetical protein [Streptomyces sp. NPDC023327]|uniref:hypothetical protein n=1 Tax=Streptomyces sp. NPDC023327 TaxID=3157088 RepID=UPI0033EC2F6C